MERDYFLDRGQVGLLWFGQTDSARWCTRLCRIEDRTVVGPSRQADPFQVYTGPYGTQETEVVATTARRPATSTSVLTLWSGPV